MINKFNEKTSQAVRDLLNNLISKGERVRIVCGNVETGAPWNEKHDVCGRIGNSTGPQKVPLLINNRRSIGGSAISDDTILAIIRISDKVWLYKNDRLQVPIVGIVHGETMAEVLVNSELYARCKDLKSAERLSAFLRFERHSR